MHLVPLYEKIVVEMSSKQEVVSESGLSYMQDLSTSKYTTVLGKVVAVGNGRLLENGTILPLIVKEGDTILFSKHSGESYSDGKKEYTVLSESNVIAILKEENNVTNN